ncbi:hypothetical protein AAVH_42829, partial [Aphelenchoides avenae]
YRNFCRACRYAKCIKAGLNAKLIYSDRDPIERKKAGSTSKAVDVLPDLSDKAASTSNGLQLVQSAGISILAGRVENQEIVDLPLGAKRAIPQFNAVDIESVIQYFLQVEQICDTYGDPSADISKYNVNVPASVAFRRPGAICPRIP